MLARRHGKYFERVVAERGDEQPLTLRIQGEMVEAAFDARQRNDLYEFERSGLLRERARQQARGQSCQRNDAFHGCDRLLAPESEIVK